MPGADDALASLGRTARKQRQPETLWYYERLLAQKRFVDGDLADAEKAFADMARVRFTRYLWLWRLPHALVAMERQPTPDTAGWDPSKFLSRTSDDDAQAASLARIAVKLGRKDLARPVLERLSARDFERIPKNISYLNKLANLALVAIELRDRTRAESLYALLEPYPHHNTPSGLLHHEGSVSHYLALLAEFLGARERAERAFNDALAMNEALGHKAQLARTYYEYARFLQAGGLQRRARRMKSEAARLSEMLELTALTEQVRAL